MKSYMVSKDMKVELNALAQQADALLAEFKGEFVCKEGCSGCCESFHWNLIEIINLRENPKYRVILKKLRKRIRSYNREYQRRYSNIGGAARDIDSLLFMFQDMPCMFLHRNRCLIYEDRPLLCRLYANRDGGTCAGFHELSEAYQKRADDILMKADVLNSRYSQHFHPGYNIKEQPFWCLR